MKIGETIRTYKKDPYRKSYIRTLYEVIRCMINEKELPHYYFSHLLYKKNFHNYLDYIGNKKSLQIRREILKPNSILDDKILFQEFIYKNNIPGPGCLAYVKNAHLIVESSSEKLTTPDRLTIKLHELLGNSTSDNAIFIKPSNGIGGGGAYKVSREKLDNPAYINNLITDLQKNDYIVQEVVIQHETLNQLHSSSLNTIRIHSYRMNNRQIGIASALSRMGYGGAHVDNISSGGIFVPIDLAKGSLSKYGYNFLAKGGGSYTAHPDTKIVFEGFRLPYFSQALELAGRAASFFENKFIGWDVAITVNGPILIEGNHNPHLMMAQTACGGFRSHPIYKELFKAYL